MTPEERIAANRKGGQKTYKNGTGLYKMTPEERIASNRKAAQTNIKNGTGIFKMTPDERREAGKKGGKLGSKNTNSQRWQCTETGHVSTPSGLSAYQKARGIDTSNRIRLE